nr:Chain D, Myosin-A [Plasmodium yoelii yoelii]4GGN_E Chain E, Myosin-A [Plasmodium yoelii yoelii]4GGN_F Chain F, Myosin-A [Plasmodium yoelii yoelii]
SLMRVQAHIRKRMVA